MAFEEVYRELETLTDSMLMIAFDRYSDCMKTLGEIKEDELKRNVHMLLRKSGMVTEAVPEDGQDA
jgi:hypothetical protein